MRFRAVLELGGKTATGIAVPAEVVERLGAGRRPAVAVTLGSHTYRTTIASMGGRFLVPVSAAVREAAGVAAGDELDVGIELDTAPRTVDPPGELAAALAADPLAQAGWDASSFSHQREHADAIAAAKKAETRE